MPRYSEIVKEKDYKIKKLQEQLEEANKIICLVDWNCDEELQKQCGFSNYLKKHNIMKG